MRRVRVVDVNAASLDAGRRRAAALGLADRMSFECARFIIYIYI